MWSGWDVAPEDWLQKTDFDSSATETIQMQFYQQEEKMLEEKTAQ